MNNFLLHIYTPTVTNGINYLYPLYETLEVTSIVMLILIVLEYVQLWRIRHAKQQRRVSENTTVQTLFAGILGFIPGCVGGLASVSLYTHGTIRFAALITASFTALGDDAFRMIGIMPKELLWISPILLALGFLVSFIIDKISFFHNFSTPSKAHIHSHHEDHHPQGRSKHFIIAHLWQHVIKKHFLPIFLWTLGTFYAFEIILHYFDLETWINADKLHVFYMLLTAIAIGWIPQSGPHFIFAQMWITSVIPFGVFFANAIVQDGHTSLVLLAESRKQFFYLKGIKSVVALVLCGILLIL
jgi:hypothetical protein